MQAHTKTTSQILAEAPDVFRVLLMRYERDVHTLTDYMLPEEQKKHLARIEEAVRIKLMMDHAWSHEASTAIAKEYRTVLNYRLLFPSQMNPALRTK